jgi:serine protease Do
VSPSPNQLSALAQEFQRLARRKALAQMVASAILATGSGFARADLPATIAKVRGSVVPVGTFSATDSPRFGFRGSGFAIGDGRLIVTNFHVLPAGAELETGARLVVLAGRSGEPTDLRGARIVASDRSRDLALLEIDGPALPALQMDEPGAAREGQAVVLLGFPIGGALGFSPVSHRGIVASITTLALPAPSARQLDPRAISRLREGNFEVLQLDATAYPGNSGGPVVDVDSGRVLGIVSMVLVKSSRESALSSPTGITYAIPVKQLQDLLRAR